MEQLSLTAIKRENARKSTTNKLRQTGFIPSVMYGKENTMIAIKLAAFEKVFSAAGEHTLVDITIEGEGTARKVLVKDYSIDPIKRHVTHVDFLEVDSKKKLRTHVPVKLNGTPAGIAEGGVLEHSQYTVYIKCLPGNIPHAIEMDVSPLGMGDSLHLRDLKLPEGVALADDGGKVLCSIVAPAKFEEVKPVAAAAAEGAAEGAGQRRLHD